MIEKRQQQADKTLYIIGWVAIIIMLIGMICLKIFDVDLRNTGMKCIFFSITGYYCPGCGGTRATYFFLSGHLLKSIYYHPVVVYLGIGGGIFMISHTLSYITKGKVKGIHFRNMYAYALIIITLVQFAFKNALIYFFQYYMLK